MALLRSETIPMPKAVEFARGLNAEMLREVLRESRMAGEMKEYLLAQVVGRGTSG
jgi:hypothetical protein